MRAPPSQLYLNLVTSQSPPFLQLSFGELGSNVGIGGPSSVRSVDKVLTNPLSLLGSQGCSFLCRDYLPVLHLPRVFLCGREQVRPRRAESARPTEGGGLSHNPAATPGLLRAPLAMP